jgi:glycosyltransferase involved in cell wall biosynthesis
MRDHEFSALLAPQDAPEQRHTMTAQHSAAPTRVVMLSPHAPVKGPVAKHTPLLVDAMRSDGCDVVSLPWGRHRDEDSLATRLLSRVHDLLKVRRVLKRTTFDVFVVKTSHEWTSLMRDLPLLLATRSSSPCTVLQFHGGHSERLVRPGSWLFKLVTRLAFDLSDGVLFLSSDEARAAATFYPAGVFRVVINPFAARVADSDRAWPSSIEERATNVLFVGRLIEEKGVMDVLDAVWMLRERLPLHLTVAGSGPMASALRHRAARLGLSEGEVRVVGEVDAGRLEALYRQSDVFVLPSYWVEGFPTVISEAMSAGLPVITTRTRGMADHLIEEENALFVPAKDPRSLARALDALLRDPVLRARMSEANRAKIKDFAPEAAAHRYRTALTDIALRRKDDVT